MKTDKLLIIQAALKCPKNQKNAFGWYNYRSCEDILEAVKPLLFDTKTTLTVSDNIVCVGDRIYVEATATLRDTETWEIIEQNVAYARESESKKWMDEAQITGASSSYARKYALNGLFLLDDVKDADATNTHWKEASETKAEKKAEPKETKAKANPQWWFQRAISNVDYMKQCLDEDDFINKVKSKYEVDDVVESQLREAYKNATTEADIDLPFN